MHEPIAIDTRNLSKRYGKSDVFALQDLTLQVQRGEVYGFLGSNGAGKTTTIRLLLNFLRPTKGNANILGMDSVEDSVKVKHEIGYLSADFELYRKLTGRQFLDYMEQLHPAKGESIRTRLTETFQAQLDKPLGELSRGNKQKIAVIQAFMHKPNVLILDEPTSGLDPLMQESFYALVREAKENGAAVFASSHNFAEVLRMCDRVGFIREGKMVAEQTIAGLVESAAHTFLITFGEDAPLAELKKLRGATITTSDPSHVAVQLTGELSPLFRILGRHKVLRLDRQAVNLEQEFLQYYGKEEA